MGNSAPLVISLPQLRRHASDTFIKASRPLTCLSLRPCFGRRGGLLLLFYLLILFALFRHHIWCAWQLGRVYAYWGIASRGIGLSQWRDGLDITFEAYDVHQYSAFPKNGTTPLMKHVGVPPPGAYLDPDTIPAISSTGMHGQDLVPPILHHILLGRPISSAPANWNASREACLSFHPESEGWEYHFWDDEKAHSFLEAHYPWFLPTFDGYRYPIQRADSLRYFVLYHYGGTFLDLDLECKRSLGPLRRFPTVAISAQPAGISNGFFMATPRHPFLAQLIESLESYDRSWIASYATIMFSTGPMFLSAEHLRFRPWWERRHDLRILVEPMHRLNGRVDTPLFRHLGSSSWHGDDAHALQAIAKGFWNLVGHKGAPKVAVPRS